jgi:hypothetical protein
MANLAGQQPTMSASTLVGTVSGSRLGRTAFAAMRGLPGRKLSRWNFIGTEGQSDPSVTYAALFRLPSSWNTRYINTK